MSPWSRSRMPRSRSAAGSSAWAARSSHSTAASGLPRSRQSSRPRACAPRVRRRRCAASARRRRDLRAPRAACPTVAQRGRHRSLRPPAAGSRLRRGRCRGAAPRAGSGVAIAGVGGCSEIVSGAGDRVGLLGLGDSRPGIAVTDGIRAAVAGVLSGGRAAAAAAGGFLGRSIDDCPRTAARAVDRLGPARASSVGGRYTVVLVIRAGVCSVSCAQIALRAGTLVRCTRACRGEGGLLGAKRGDPIQDRLALLVLALVRLDVGQIAQVTAGQPANDLLGCERVVAADREVVSTCGASPSAGRLVARHGVRRACAARRLARRGLRPRRAGFGACRSCRLLAGFRLVGAANPVGRNGRNDVEGVIAVDVGPHDGVRQLRELAQ